MSEVTDTLGRVKELPELVLPTLADWRAWLDAHEAEPDGVWLRLAKKGFSSPTAITYEPAVLEALCSGWIDGQARRCDERSSWQRFTPRRPRSAWSALNVTRAGRLADEGRMRPRGAAEVQRARDDGRWDAAYAGAATIQPTPELLAALAASPEASAVFATLTGNNRFAVLYRTSTPRTPQGRARAVERLVAALARGEVPYPPGGAGDRNGPA